MTIVNFNPNSVKVIVFDVDDTVTRGTQQIKLDSWQKLFSDKLETLQEARELYEYTGIGDRHNIIAHVIGEPQEDCVNNKLVKEWAQKFEGLIQNAIRENGIHPDDLTALVRIGTDFKGCVYLLSATPQTSVEANIIFFMGKYPELQGVFNRVIGSPLKSSVLRDICGEHKILPENTLMVGDGQGDYIAACGAETQFIGIVPEGKKNQWDTQEVKTLKGISDLPALLGS